MRTDKPLKREEGAERNGRKLMRGAEDFLGVVSGNPSFNRRRRRRRRNHQNSEENALSILQPFAKKAKEKNRKTFLMLRCEHVLF